MATMEEKRVDWLYEHFQAVSRASDRYVALYGVLVLSAIAVWLTPERPIELPFVKVEAARQLLLGCTVLAGAFTFNAFCGNYDHGEKTLDALCTALSCEYSELWFVDTHPTIIDFARNRRDGVAKRRRFPSRAAAALLYPICLVGALLFLTFIWGYETFMGTMTALETIVYVLCIPTLFVAWHRALEYIGRRWRTFLATEEQRQSPPAAPVSKDVPAAHAT